MLLHEVDARNLNGTVSENSIEFGCADDDSVEFCQFSGGFDFATDMPEAVEVGGFRFGVVVDKVGGAQA